MKVSIIIPAYNAAATIHGVVDGALAQDYPDKELIVVDDGSADGTGDIVRDLGVGCITQKNAGPASARNAGWRASTGDVVVFTDSDCVPKPGWLGALVRGFNSPGVGAVAGSYDIANPEGLLPRLIHEEIKERHAGYGDTVRFFGSYNVAIRRTVLEQTGGFDEGYRRASGEDNDLSYRVMKLGHNIAYAPEALVAHHHTTRLGKYLREQYTHGVWRMKLYRDHPDMAGGDDYTKLKDVMEPPLALISLAALPVLPILPATVLMLAVLLFALQVPAALKLTARLKTPVYLMLAPVTFLRGYARGLGLLAGFIRFIVRDKR